MDQQRFPSRVPPGSHFLGLPATRPGKWAGGLALVFWVLLITGLILTNMLPEKGVAQRVVLPLSGLIDLLCGLAAGALGLHAILRRGERSWLLWLAILAAAAVFYLLIGGFLDPN